MKKNYDKCLKAILVYEGGYVNHPKDPGGATNRGITQQVYSNWLTQKGKPPKHVKNITMEEVKAIYRVQYWDAVRGDQLPTGIDLAVFDFAVNSGVSRSVRAIQKILSMPMYDRLTGGDIAQDGNLGEVTLAATDRVYSSDEEKFIALFCEERLRFVKSLRTWSTFGKGWQRRIMGKKDGAQDDDVGVIDMATAMARGETVEMPKIEGGGVGKANTEDVAIETTPEGAAGGTGLVGGAGVVATKVGVGTWIGNNLIALGEFAGMTKDQVEPLVQYSSWIGYIFIALMVAGALGTIAVRVKKQREGRQ